jgi:hypothetical protein
LLLPCNVVIRADGDGATLVEALDPQLMVEMTGQAGLKPVAILACTSSISSSRTASIT